MDSKFLKTKTWISSAHQGSAGDNIRGNTLSSFYRAALKGADMVETDARTTKDGVLVCNHNPEVKGFDKDGNPVEYVISETDSKTITSVILAPNDPMGVQYVPTLAQLLNLCYFTGMQVDIDLKEGLFSAEKVAHLVLEYGMRGRVVYATNGAGAEAIKRILAIDPDARFIDKVQNYTKENLESIENYQSKCFAYTADFSEETIKKVRESGCMLATISLNKDNVLEAFKHHPDMAEYPHIYDFEELDKKVIRELNPQNG